MGPLLIIEPSILQRATLLEQYLHKSLYSSLMGYNFVDK